MYNYKTFKEEVIKNFKEVLPEELADCEIRVKRVNKINCAMDGFTLLRKGANVSPTLYLDVMYKDYLQNRDLKKTMQNAATMFHNFWDKIAEVRPLEIEEYINNVIPVLVNTELNKGWLAEVPHREFLDLSVIYKIVFSSDQKGIRSLVVNNEIQRIMGEISEQDLFIKSLENSRRLNPPRVSSMIDVIMSNNDEKNLDELEVNEGEMLVLSNRQGINGAASILYTDIIKTVADKFGSDIVIIPSSIHEIIIASALYSDPEELHAMIENINDTEVSEEDRLSDYPYYYYRETGEFKIYNSKLPIVASANSR